MKLTVVGAGAVGRLWGCKLSLQHEVHFWTRDSAPSLTVELNPLAPNEKSATCSFPANHPARLTQADCILVTVKAFQVEQALEDIRRHLKPETPVIIMHNGMGTQDIARKLLPETPLLYATTAQAAFRPDEQQVSHTGIGQTWLGALNTTGKEHKALADELNYALPPCQWHDDIAYPLWQKLAINCAINPLTAIHQCRNGELANQNYSQQLTDICHEVAQVMTAEGYPTNSDELKQLADKVIKATSQNFSSMNQDICQHRPTEIDYITGYLIARAKAHRITVPVNTRLWQQIKQLEQHNNDQ